MTSEELARLAAVRSLVASGDARRHRETARLSLGEVAGACGVNQSTVSRWETGARVPRGAAALRYARLLELISRQAVA